MEKQTIVRTTETIEWYEDGPLGGGQVHVKTFPGLVNAEYLKSKLGKLAYEDGIRSGVIIPQ